MQKVLSVAENIKGAELGFLHTVKRPSWCFSLSIFCWGHFYYRAANISSERRSVVVVYSGHWIYCTKARICPLKLKTCWLCCGFHVVTFFSHPSSSHISSREIKMSELDSIRFFYQSCIAFNQVLNTMFHSRFGRVNYKFSKGGNECMTQQNDHGRQHAIALLLPLVNTVTIVLTYIWRPLV